MSRSGRDLVVRNCSFEAVPGRINQIVADLDAIPIRRYREPKRLTMKARLDVADFLDRYVLRKIRQSNEPCLKPTRIP